MHFSKESGCQFSAASARKIFNRFRIALYQTLSVKYKNSENIKADRVNTVVSTYIKSNIRRFGGTRYTKTNIFLGLMKHKVQIV